MRKRILVFAHENSMNGASHSLFAILNDLQEEYNFMVIVPQEGPFTHYLHTANINYRVLEIPRTGLFYKMSKKEYLNRIIKYKKHVKSLVNSVIDAIGEFKPEIVYTNTSVLNIGVHTADHLTIPHIWHIREYGDLDFGINYFPSKTYTKYLMRKSKLVIFTTNLLLKHWYGIRSENSLVIHNGFDKINKNRQVKSISTENIKIGLVGYFVRGKGQLEALNILYSVLKENVQAQLYFYGEFNANSEYYKEIINEIEKKNLTNSVFFCGYKPQDEIYSNIDFLLSCANFEAFGRSLIEAMSYGIPVVSKNSGGPQEIISQSEDGFLYNSIKEAKAFILDCAKNNHKYQQISKNAQEKVLNKFGNKKYINNMNEIFRNV